MDNLVDLEKFANIGEADKLITLLEAKNIEFFVDDTNSRYTLVPTSDTIFNNIVVKVKEEDLEKANDVLAKYFEKNIYEDDDRGYGHTLAKKYHIRHKEKTENKNRKNLAWNFNRFNPSPLLMAAIIFSFTMLLLISSDMFIGVSLGRFYQGISTHGDKITIKEIPDHLFYYLFVSTPLAVYMYFLMRKKKKEEDDNKR